MKRSQSEISTSHGSDKASGAQTSTDVSRRNVLGLGANLGAAIAASATPSLGWAQNVDATGKPLLNLTRDPTTPLSPLPPQLPAKARRVIYLHMGGGLSHLDLFDYKPELVKFDGKEAPQALLEGKQFPFITGKPTLMGPLFPFHQAGESGSWISDRFPHLENHIDDICFIKSMRSTQFNHVPAILLKLTGDARPGYPSLGAWVNYALGTVNQNLPGFIQLNGPYLSDDNSPESQYWGSGFLPSAYQGMVCQARGEPILYLDNPPGVERKDRRRVLDAIAKINQQTLDEFKDPETLARSAQFEMAYRMQAEAPEAMDVTDEPQWVLDMYGAEPGRADFAMNCLLARRLAERGVRFTQLWQWGWDSHGTSRIEALNDGFINMCDLVDKPVAALLSDLKMRGLLEDTLVVFSTEFGRTSMKEPSFGELAKWSGRDHNPGGFTIWMAGAGVKGGTSYGETDDLGLDVASNPVEVRDLHATILHALGFDHHALTYRYQGLDQKITGVKPARVIKDIFA